MKGREIRAVSATHADARVLIDRYVAELRARLGGFEPERSVSAEPEEMAPPLGAFLVVYVDGVAIACGGLKRHATNVGEIKRMFVADEARGRGHGRALLGALE